jgi:hypothetical protein
MIPASSPTPLPPPSSASLTERLLEEVHCASFDFDKSNVPLDAITALTEDAAARPNILRDSHTQLW